MIREKKNMLSTFVVGKEACFSKSARVIGILKKNNHFKFGLFLKYLSIIMHSVEIILSNAFFCCVPDLSFRHLDRKISFVFF